MGANLAQKIADDVKGLVSERVLPFDIILKTIVLAQGALWKHRVFRGGSSHSHRRSMPAGAAAARPRHPRKRPLNRNRDYQCCEVNATQRMHNDAAVEKVDMHMIITTETVMGRLQLVEKR